MAIRIIQVGLGAWGRDWSQNVLPIVPEVERVACVDSSPGSLKLAQTTLDIPPARCFTSLEAALSVIEADAVLATVAVPAHVPVALAALDAGMHVLLEKPFATSLDEARRVVDTAEARERVLMISQNYRFFPAVQAVMQLVRNEELGPVGAVNIDFRRNMTVLRQGHPYLTLDHPLLMDMAIHHLDLMRAVLDQEPERVTCHAWNPPWSPINGLAAGRATIVFGGGTVVSYRGSWVSPGPPTPWAGEWRMECAGGEIVWTSRSDGIKRLEAESVVVRPLAGPERTLDLPTLRHVGRAGVLSAFANAIATGQEPPCSGRDNLGSIALMSAAVASAATGQSVVLPANAIAAR